MFTERNLRVAILAAYGIAMTQMLWTGTFYRFVGHAFMVFQLAAVILVWVLVAAGLFSVRRPDTHGPSRDGMTAGILYAVFALPPLVYLLSL